MTGGSGFAGGQLARSLAARRYHVRVVARSPERARDLRTAGIELCQGDLNDAASLERACQGVRIVYNVAAIYRRAGCPLGVPGRQRRGGRHADRGGARAGVRRVVHCSTVGVHGDVEHPPATEDAPLKPGDSTRKRSWKGSTSPGRPPAGLGVELVVVRPSGIYGPGDRRLLKLFRGVARRRFVVLGSGRIYYHLTYVDDLAEAFRLCGETARAAGRTYIIAGGEVTRLNELVRLIAQEAGVKPIRLRFPVWPVWIAGAICEGVCVPLGVEPPLYRRRVDFFTKSRAFDISRARVELGYNPRVGLREGVRRCLEWYRGMNWL